jgi:hypothetical protein
LGEINIFLKIGGIRPAPSPLGSDPAKIGIGTDETNEIAEYNTHLKCRQHSKSINMTQPFSILLLKQPGIGSSFTWPLMAFYPSLSETLNLCSLKTAFKERWMNVTILYYPNHERGCLGCSVVWILLRLIPHNLRLEIVRPEVPSEGKRNTESWHTFSSSLHCHLSNGLHIEVLMFTMKTDITKEISRNKV